MNISVSQNWNPIKARSSCFQQILPLVKDLLTGEKKETVTGSILAANDRLLQLIIKGLEMDLFLCFIIIVVQEFCTRAALIIVNRKPPPRRIPTQSSLPTFSVRVSSATVISPCCLGCRYAVHQAL